MVRAALVHAEASPSAPGAPAAQALFEAARRLMEEGKFAEACLELAESHRLDPAAGTLLNLAVCHEKEGKTASAWVEYNDLLGTKGNDDAAERRRIAAERIREIEPRLARVTFVPDPADADRDLVIALDGAQLHRAAMGVALPVDPGPHRIAVTAAGRKTWSGEIAALEPRTSRTVQVPRLELLPPPVANPGGITAGGAAMPPVPPAANPRRAAAYAAVAGAVVGLAAAGYFGYLAKNEWDRRNDRCVPDCDSPDATTTAGRALTLARVADVVAGLSLVSGVIGGYLYVTSATPAAARPAAGPSISADASRVTLSYRGAF